MLFSRVFSFFVLLFLLSKHILDPEMQIKYVLATVELLGQPVLLLTAIAKFRQLGKKFGPFSYYYCISASQ